MAVLNPIAPTAIPSPNDHAGSSRRGANIIVVVLLLLFLFLFLFLLASSSSGPERDSLLFDPPRRRFGLFLDIESVPRDADAEAGKSRTLIG